MPLMTFEEMKKRYDDGEDSLELTLEKWEKILEFSKNVFHLSHYQEVLKACVVPVFLCTEYENQCHLCPINEVCKQGQSEDWTRLMRVVQAYAIAGDLLPQGHFREHIESFVNKLRDCHRNVLKRLH